ncbi:MAG: hypothetical protein PVH40_01120 [Gemmatimonadales bacterium]|jgi:hypothetical protein
MRLKAKTTTIFAFSIATVSVASASAQFSPTDQEIAGAIAPLPENLRDGAGVLGYRDGSLVELREASNGIICLGDDPAQGGFHAACYHRDLEPFMARGRQLRAAGHGTAAVDSVRQAEIEAETLAMPLEPRALYSLSSRQEADAATGVPADARGLYVIYVPYATEASTGISAKPAGDRPWLMDPGTPWAHVMISR